jgi:rhodanese-related sulfurtransferase
MTRIEEGSAARVARRGTFAGRATSLGGDVTVPGMTPRLADSDLEVTTEQTAAALSGGAAQVIDVREPHEREAGHIAGTRHIELQRLPSSAETIDRDRPVIFHCRVGARSLMAAEAFRRAGFQAYSMAGGLARWADEGRPLEPQGGYVADD